MLAARDNRIAVVERLIEMGVNINEQAKVRSCLLRNLICFGSYHDVVYLVFVY